MKHLIIALLLASTLSTIPGATVQTEQSCHSGVGSVSYILTSTGPAAPRYIIPGMTAYPQVSLLSTEPGQVVLAGDTVAWQPAKVGDVAVLIGAGAAGCPPASTVRARWLVWLPVVLR